MILGAEVSHTSKTRRLSKLNPCSSMLVQRSFLLTLLDLMPVVRPWLVNAILSFDLRQGLFVDFLLNQSILTLRYLLIESLRQLC